MKIYQLSKLWIQRKWDEFKRIVIGAVLRIYAKVTEYFTAMKNALTSIMYGESE